MRGALVDEAPRKPMMMDGGPRLVNSAGASDGHETGENAVEGGGYDRQIIQGDVDAQGGSAASARIKGGSHSAAGLGGSTIAR